MDKKYEMKYQESKEFIMNSCRLYNIDNGSNLPWLVVAVGGVALIFAMLVQEIPQNAPSLSAFCLKFLAGWAAAFLIAYIFWKIVGVKLSTITADGTGVRLYEIRMRDREEPIEVQIAFYEDRFTYVGNNSERTYSYKEIVKLVEAEDIAGMALRETDGRKVLFFFPLTEVTEMETSETRDVRQLKEFLEKKCVNAKKGKFIKISYGILGSKVKVKEK